MRVLMTADGVGGVWEYATDLGATLGRCGVEVVLAVMGPSLTPDQRAVATQCGLDVVEGPYRLEWMDDPWRDVEAAGGWLLALERELAPDVVHLNGYCHATLRWQAPTVVVGHSCVRSWWRAVHGTPAPPSWDRYSSAVARGLRAARQVIAPSKAMSSALRVEYGTFGDVDVIPNARRVDERAAAEQKANVVFVAGRVWDAAKNIEALCDVAPQLPWQVVVAGDNGASEPGGPVGPVRRLGRLSAPDVARWYRRAGIYALPARYEPFGLSVLEAALAGCPLVLGDIPSLRENWSGVAAFVPPDDRAALAACLQRLIADPVRRAEMGARARSRVREFSVERMASAYMNVYDRNMRSCPVPRQ
jgi:glycogen(starch) synthase